ncbi:MAG: hypothetical protein ACE5KD_00545 [Candidatus Bathyarchaeia archaeon]
MKKILLVSLAFLFLIPNVLSVATKESLESTIPEGGWYKETFVLEDDNPGETPCPLVLTGDFSVYDEIVNVPSELDLNETTQTIDVIITIPTDSPLTSYHGDIYYCNADIDVDIDISGTIKEEAKCIDTIKFRWYPSKPNPGAKMMFYVFNESSGNTVNAIITVKSFIPENPEVTVMCEKDGYCEDYEIPLNEKGIMLHIEVPGCGIKEPVDVSLSEEVITNETITWGEGGAEISIYGPVKVNLGENYQFLVVGENRPLKLVDIKVVGPEAYSFVGTTSDMGLIVDSSLKVFGTEVKPGIIGDYTIFAELEGFTPNEFHFSVVREECPHDCCEDDSYKAKACPTGFQCVDNKCEEITKPKLTVKCEPEEPFFGEEISCKLYDPDDNLIEDSVQGSLSYADKKENLIFADGIANFTTASAGKFMVEIPDVLGFEGDTYVGAVVTPPIPWVYVFIFFGVIVVLIIVVVILKIVSKKRGKPAGPEIVLESTPPTVEKVVTEK